MVVSDLIKDINDKVDNTVSRRFTDNSIILTINECLREIAVTTNFYNKSEVLQTVIDTKTYNKPAGLNNITQAYFDGTPIVILTTVDMDIKSPAWRKAGSSHSVTHLIYDSIESKFTVYPTPSVVKDITLIGKSVLTDLTATTDVVDFNELYKNIIVFYVSGMLLINTGRTEDVNKGSQYLKLYNQKINSFSSATTVSKSSDVAIYNTPFKGK